MNAWVLRAVGLGALTVGLRALLGVAMVQWPTNGSWMRPLGLLVLIAAVLAWGVLDGRADADGQRDLTMRWLKAGLAGGIGAGAVAWILDYLPGFDLGDNGLLFEITSGASFIILVIFIPGVLGVALGRYLVRRRDNSDTASDLPNSTKESATV
ncbi:B-4DMT family transporter [Nocardia uniformis]|uniref:B-4DMT family transporter n=1 Tax=Nocardia uniformis TaxID=53432 RepID=A0A849C6W4_9NOCA|nr:B-4DMT family transporter [Nocardia uniformis]NNH71587.1 B-4DMT family transporter [Nocardia uniformis]